MFLGTQVYKCLELIDLNWQIYVYLFQNDFNIYINKIISSTRDKETSQIHFKCASHEIHLKFIWKISGMKFIVKKSSEILVVNWPYELQILHTKEFHQK